MLEKLLAAVAALSIAIPSATSAEPLDLDLAKLGAPSAAVWNAIASNLGVSSANASLLASDAKARFATLSLETALAFSSPLLQPASTTGVVGWDIGLEGWYAPVHSKPMGTASLSTDFLPTSPFPTSGAPPNGLEFAGLHVRKALPFSLELGGRAIYLFQSNYYAPQVEVKAALLEGYRALPDFALRGSYTAILGQRDWNLSTAEVDALVSKRFGLSAVVTVTPYAAARVSFVSASSQVIDFSPNASLPASEQVKTQAAFPSLHAGVLRYTAGAKINFSTFSLGLEGSFVGPSTISGSANPTDSQYPTVKLASNLSGSFRLGWDF